MSARQAPPYNPDPEAAKAAERTHTFDWQELRCMTCDCRPGGRWASYPCEG